MEMHLQVVPQHVPLGGPQVAHQAGIRMLISHHGGANLLQGKAAEPVSNVQPRGQPSPLLGTVSGTRKGIVSSGKRGFQYHP